MPRMDWGRTNHAINAAQPDTPDARGPDAGFVSGIDAAARRPGASRPGTRPSRFGQLDEARSGNGQVHYRPDGEDDAGGEDRAALAAHQRLGFDRTDDAAGLSGRYPQGSHRIDLQCLHRQIHARASAPGGRGNAAETPPALRLIRKRDGSGTSVSAPVDLGI